MPYPYTEELAAMNEWDMPEKALDEQFYIAMRWPYSPSSIGDSLKDKFIKKYFDQNISKGDLVGTPKDYKNAHVLVYNPNNNIAVVCKPAYFLWGDKTTSTTQTDQALEREGENDGKNMRQWFIQNNLQIDAVVSPDAGFFLGVLSGEKVVFTSSEQGSYGQLAVEAGPNYRDTPMPQECYFAFVPNTVPLGVATNTFSPIKKFKAKNDQGQELEDFVIGFGNFEGEELIAEVVKEDDAFYRKYPQLKLNDGQKNSTNEYIATSKLIDLDLSYGGNYSSYFQRAINPLDSQSKDSEGKALDPVSKQVGLDLMDQSGAQSGSTTTGEFNSEYVPVFSIGDPIGIEARKFYEENYDMGVSVIAGSGRSLSDAQEIWNQFRSAYHTYESVKTIFTDTYGLNPEDNEEFPQELANLFTLSNSSQEDVFKKFRDSMSSANDEFSILLGNEISGQTSAAIEFARRNFIDTVDNGLIQYFNDLVKTKVKKFKENFLILNDSMIRDSANIPSTEINFIKTPRQLFLTLVGLFRQKLWQDPYSRAWLVLKPSRKIGIGFGAWGDQWDFRTVDKIFAAFIDPYGTYANPSKDSEFKKLLYKNKGQGSDAGNILAKTSSAVNNFWDKSVGPIMSAIGAGLQGLLQMFRVNMLQTGYGLSEIGSLSKQANILNKALNDSIYYSLGRPGSLLRAVDNPFTREYGEPVVEIREPFQRMHYLSSFSHILSNQIMETNFNVSTVVTAVSDGRFPVTVALDKGAPSDRQVESTVETGIFFDNAVGEGFAGILHPLLHPFETYRGTMKNLTGSPDELLAKRIGLAHLKENIKDIYGGELLVIGNPDIRPHDLVYIADVYERMYGLFEVEQVIHHFTSELGFVTSITPNALVTVNDPARWYMTSWIDSWMNTQAIRNDTRLFINSVQANNIGISSGGNISIERLASNLEPQMMGGIQYTHGASAVIKDTVAAMTYGTFEKNPSFTEAIKKQAQANGNNGQLGATAAIMLGVSQGVPLFGNLIWKGWTWVRDNLLDQHGAYVQYLSKNGQPMDAGLSYNQGMVVGRYHSKNLLPGILGIRRKTRTAEGNAYIRTDDLLKNLGWNEVEIKELVRYIGYENAMVHAKVLNLSGLGPEKTGFEPFFKVLVKLDETQGIALEQGKSARKTGVIDGDTIHVVDILSGAKFKIRFDGINTPEKTQISTQMPQGSQLVEGENGQTKPVDTIVDIIPKQTPGYGATAFTYNALKDKVFLLRIKQNASGNLLSDSDQEIYDPGSEKNKDRNYLKDSYDRILSTIFYKTSEETLTNIKSYVLSLFIKHDYSKELINKEFQNSFYENSFLSIPKNYEKIFEQLKFISDYTIGINDSEISSSQDLKILYSKLIQMKIAEELYAASSKWPIVLWDEYYNDGTPYTLNWELVINNLANVFMYDVVSKEGSAVIDSEESGIFPSKVPLKEK